MANVAIVRSPSVASAATSRGHIGRQFVSKPLPSTLAFPRSRKPGAVVAKYGEKSVYFDLEDIGNTTGSWDLYGSDSPSPYNAMQSKFFETSAGIFTKRGLLLRFLVLGGAGTLAYVSSTVGGDLLPIKKGPTGPPTPGPGGKI